MSWQVNDVGGGIPAMEAVQADAEAIVSALSPESMDIPIVSIASPTLIFTAECLDYRKTGKRGQKRHTRLLLHCVALCHVGCQACLLGQLACCQVSVVVSTLLSIFLLPLFLTAAFSLSMCLPLCATVSTCIVNSPLSLLPS